MIKTKNKTITLCLVGMMSALVFIGTSIKISIPIGSSSTMIHLGNIFCILSALLLGPLFGGLSAGIGSFLFDVMNSLYISDAPFIFIFKFLMAFICASIAKKNFASIMHVIVGMICGSLTYMGLYVSKNFIKNTFLLKIEIHASFLLTLKSLYISSINAALSIIIAIIIFKIIYVRIGEKIIQ